MYKPEDRPCEKMHFCIFTAEKSARHKTWMVLRRVVFHTKNQFQSEEKPLAFRFRQKMQVFYRLEEEENKR